MVAKEIKKKNGIELNKKEKKDDEMRKGEKIMRNESDLNKQKK